MGGIRDVLRIPNATRLLVGWGLSLLGSSVLMIATLLVAFDSGGALLVSLYAVGRAVAGGLVSSGVSSLGDRMRLDRLLVVTSAAGFATGAGAAATALTGGPAALVVVLAILSAAACGAFKPLEAAAIPWVVHAPGELVAANVAGTVTENVAALAGPVLAGAVVAASTPTAAIVVSAVLLLGPMAALALLRLPDRTGHRHATALRGEGRWVGVRTLLSVGKPGGVAALVGMQTFARGFLTVLIVILALEVLHSGQPSVGWMTAAMGIGGIAGGIVASAVVRLGRLGRTLCLGIALWGAPLVALAFAPGLALAVTALAVVGVGNALEDSATRTLLPRLAGPARTGRTLGALNLLAFAGVGIGSAVAPPLITALGVDGSLLLVGGILVALAIAYVARFAQVDRQTPTPGPELDLLRGLPMFAPLPLVIVEDLASSTRRHRYADGEVVLRQGDAGHDFHVIESGTAAVEVSGSPRPALAAGSGFGEIALLRDSPRTATVTALGPLVTRTLAQEKFLLALRSDRSSVASGNALADARLAADDPAPPAGV